MSDIRKRILIADDHGIVRLGLTLILKKIQPFAYIKEVKDYKEVIESIRDDSYDLAIIDVNMPNGNFQETLHLIKARQPSCKILVFSAQDEEVYALRYLKMGADGFLHKLSSEDQTEIALSRMLERGNYISDIVQDQLIQVKFRKTPLYEVNSKTTVALLSDRELEVARRIAKGESLKDISWSLNLHVSTVSTYKSRIFKKLNVNNLAELIEILTLEK